MRYKDRFRRPILDHLDVVGSWHCFLPVVVSLLALGLLLANSCPGVALFGCSSLAFRLNLFTFRTALDQLTDKSVGRLLFKAGVSFRSFHLWIFDRFFPMPREDYWNIDDCTDNSVILQV